MADARTGEERAILNSCLEMIHGNRFLKYIQLMESKEFSFVEMLCRTEAFVKVRVAAGNSRTSSSNTKSPAHRRISVRKHKTGF